MTEKIYGKSIVRKNGILKVGAGKKGKPKAYLRIPYSLLRADDFIALDDLAVKVYFIILRQWRTDHPDDPVEISFKRIRKLCAKKNKDGKEVLPGYTRLANAIKQLVLSGFIHKTIRHRQCNKYWIEQKWFTGEYT